MSARSIALGRSAGLRTVEVPSVAAGAFHIPSLDGMRAVAVMIVFVAHAGLSHIVPGGFGVTVFFFLSGYLITTLLRREFEQHGKIGFAKFYLRRVYRIFPPLYLVLAILVALQLSGFLDHPMSWTAVLAQVFHLTNYYLIGYPSVEAAPVVPHTVPFWSLAVEEHFYLLFPLALLLLLRRSGYARAAFLLGVACATVLLWRVALLGIVDDPGHYTYHATDTRIDSLLYGCIMGLWLNPALDKQPGRMTGRLWALACGIAVLLLAVSFLWRAEEFRATLRYTLQGIALFPLFYCAVRYHRSALFSWLNTRPVRALGLVSYTFYLSHYAAIDIAGKLLDADGLARGVAGFVLAAAFSAACYLLIEKRFAAMRRKLHG
jgi:peptidoglycan/LPS O-acetylase OafA/YrhL